MTSLSLLTLNIANPSAERAERQLGWLAERPEDVFVLTETKASQGCALLADAFKAAGYAVFDSRPAPGEYGVMIISKVQALPDDFTDRVDYLPTRAGSCLLPVGSGSIRLIGVYVPSRDASPEKIERKQRWLDAFNRALDTCHDQPMLLLGDLNVLEPDHQPAYRFFAPFEYDFYRGLSSRHGLIDAFRRCHGDHVEHSWVGRTGDGYRYDHAFSSASLRDGVARCGYEHQVRLDKLSDHSAMTLRLSIEPPRPLDVIDPTMATQEATLF